MRLHSQRERICHHGQICCYSVRDSIGILLDPLTEVIQAVAKERLRTAVQAGVTAFLVAPPHLMDEKVR